MVKKKQGGKKSLVQAAGVPADVIVGHPVFLAMKARLDTIQTLMERLPQVIGQAVAEATRRAPEGASGPAVPVVDTKDVVMAPRQLNIDGKKFSVKLEPPKVVCLEHVDGSGIRVTTPGVVGELTLTTVKITPIDIMPDLEAKPSVWSLSTGQRLDPSSSGDLWRIFKQELDLLVKCAREV
jgi:hypothetical protein